MEEIKWDWIKGYEGLYKISTDAQVYSVPKQTNNQFSGLGTYLNPVTQPNGYFYFTLYKDGKGKQLKRSRLVALTFIPNPENKATVNHKNGNKADDRVINLEWNTITENNRHAIKTGLNKPHLRAGDKHALTKITDAQTFEILQKSKAGLSYTKLAKEYGVCIASINYAVNRAKGLPGKKRKSIL